MTREEQIEQAAKRYVKDIVSPLPASLTVAFIKGAMWADKHPTTEWIDKACEWLKKSTILADTTIERFRKAMEE